jgi:hypothetical protein
MPMFSQLYILHKIGRDNFDLGLKLFGATNGISQAIADEMAEYTKKALRQSASACEKLADAKTIDARLDVQKDHAKAALDDLLAHTDKMGDLYLALAKESAESIDAAIERRSADGPHNLTVEEPPSIDTDVSMSPVAHPSRPPERSVVRGIVANAVKEAAEAVRATNPRAN